MKLDLYFWALLDKICHKTRLTVKYYWAHRICWKVCDACEKYNDFRFF